MMSNLFSTFDPSTLIFSLNWLSTLIIWLLLPMSFWLIPSRFNMIWFIINKFLYNELKIISYKKSSLLIFISMFMFIMINNLMGLFPYIFTSSSHMTFTLTLALPMWFSFMIFGWLNNTIHMLAHMVPLGTPGMLMSFMVIIESISNMIRPGTLAIRLMANMIAGHLLLTLLGNTGNSLNMIMLNILIIAQLMLIMLETAVAMIQSYVFTILSTLYSSEIH